MGRDLPDKSNDPEVAVVSFDLVPRFPDCLTEAERDVVRRLMADDSYRKIADERQTSTNTVGNQVASIFDKMAVNSRAELALKLHAHCARCRAPSRCPDCPVLTERIDAHD